jgi:hypothetical protein
MPDAGKRVRERFCWLVPLYPNLSPFMTLGETDLWDRLPTDLPVLLVLVPHGSRPGAARDSGSWMCMDIADH